MPDYFEDTSPFKKWQPVKNWFESQNFPIQNNQNIPVLCDKVNRDVNFSYIYQRDGLSDIWFTPDEFVAGEGGDCEDYSIFKMYRLAQEGVDLNNMEVVICTDKQSREYHAVLRVFNGTDQYVLDNQTVALLTETSFNERYAPVFAIGPKGWRVCES